MTPRKPAMLHVAAMFILVIGLGHLADAQPATPAADDPASVAEATRLYEEGKRHYDIGEYAQAIASWKQSYLRSSAPLLLFNIAQAYRLSNNCAQANRFYLNYRRSEPHPKNQAELDKAMARCAGVDPATGDPPTSEPPTSPEPSPAQPRTDPPTSPPTTTGVDRATTPPATTGVDHAAARPSNRGGRLRTAGLITGAVGAAALVVSGVYAIQARQDSDTVSGAGVGTPYTGELASADRSGKTAATRARVLLGLGAVLAVAGGAMWYVGHRRGNAQIDVAIAPGHTEVAFTCAF